MGAAGGTASAGGAEPSAAGTVKSFGALSQRKGPGLKLQMAWYRPGVMGPRHVAEQENPHPYSNDPEVTNSPSGLMMR